MMYSHIAYHWRRSPRAKSLQVHITPWNGIEVVIPRHVSRERARAFVAKHRQWIRDTWERMREQILATSAADFQTFADVLEQVADRGLVVVLGSQTAIEAMKLGAFDYLIKPVDFGRVEEILRRAFDAAYLMRVPAVLPTLEPRDQIVGRRKG